MAWVTPDFVSTWESGQQIGAATPTTVVQIQKGWWKRGYWTWPGPPLDANLFNEPQGSDPGPGTGGFWFPIWQPIGGWVDLPNIQSVKITKDFAQNGVKVLEITMDALDFAERTGPAGDVYHVLAPGFLAPYRGFVPAGRPDPGWAASDMTGEIVDGVKIRVWQGFGDPVADPDGSMPPTSGGDNGCWTFVGQLDDVDTDAGDSQGTLNTMVITARDGKLLTDEQLFGWTKSRQLPDPIIFYDDLAADTVSLVGYSPKASGTESASYPVRNVIDLPRQPWDATDPAYGTVWRSGGEDKPWVEILIPQGRYEDCWLAIDTAFNGMVGWISLFARNIVYRSLSTSYASSGSTANETIDPPRMDGVDQAAGWLGTDMIPGETIPYIRAIPQFGNQAAGPPNLNIAHFFHIIECGDRSILRVTFDQLPTVDGQPRVEVQDFHARKRKLTSDAAAGKWITVPDASDVVKVVLRWAGYTDWDVETAGVRLNGRLIFNRSQKPIDIINTIATQTGFVFFLADPKNGNGEAIPTFRRDSSLLKDNTYVAADLRDDGNLTAVKRKASDVDRLFIVRVRGTSTPPSRDIPGRGVNLPYSGDGPQPGQSGAGFQPLGGDTVKRIMATYLPPWARGITVPGIYTSANAGIIRRIIYQDDNIQTYAQCYMGCFLIALRCALAIHTVQVTIPAHPIVELDDQVTILDEPSGTNSRMWVTKMTSTMALGDLQTATGSGGAGSWTSELEGALMDTPEFQSVVADALAVDWAALAAHTASDPNQPPLPAPIQSKQRPARTRGWPPT